MKSAISVSLTSASQINISDHRTSQHDQLLQVSPKTSDAWRANASGTNSYYDMMLFISLYTSAAPNTMPGHAFPFFRLFLDCSFAFLQK